MGQGTTVSLSPTVVWFLSLQLFFHFSLGGIHQSYYVPWKTSAYLASIAAQHNHCSFGISVECGLCPSTVTLAIITALCSLLGLVSLSCIGTHMKERAAYFC